MVEDLLPAPADLVALVSRVLVAHPRDLYAVRQRLEVSCDLEFCFVLLIQRAATMRREPGRRKPYVLEVERSYVRRIIEQYANRNITELRVWGVGDVRRGITW